MMLHREGIVTLGATLLVWYSTRAAGVPAVVAAHLAAVVAILVLVWTWDRRFRQKDRT